MKRQNHFIPILIAIGAILSIGSASAQFTISESPSALPEAGAILDNLSSQNDPIVTLNRGASYVSGSLSGQYAAPVFSSSAQPSDFGQGSYTGAIQSQYISVFGGGSATMNFNASENYLGLLWGSVDSYNQLSFYDGSTLVGSIGGNQIVANAQGNLNEYVNINSALSFDKVVASSGANSFEFADIAYNRAVGAAPATPAPPLSACLAFAGVLALQAFRKSSQSA